MQDNEGNVPDSVIKYSRQVIYLSIIIEEVLTNKSKVDHERS